MLVLKIVLSVSLLTGLGISSAEAKPQVASTKSHAEVSIGAKILTESNQRSQSKSKAPYVCSAMQGMAYGAALVGIQSTLIVLPSFASGVGAPVGAIATGVGVVATGVGFVAMVAHDMVCK